MKTVVTGKDGNSNLLDLCRDECETPDEYEAPSYTPKDENYLFLQLCFGITLIYCFLFRLSKHMIKY